MKRYAIIGRPVAHSLSPRIHAAFARRFGPRLRQLTGYGLYRGIIGHIDKHSPAEILGDAPDARVFDF